MTGKVTKRSVEAIKADGKDAFLWDTELPGFGCKVTPAARRVYLLQTYVAGRLRRITIGAHGTLTAEQARQQAQRLLAEIACGKDPAQARSDARSAPTVDELADRYLKEHAETHKKARSADQDERTLDGHIRRRLGTKRVADVTRTDIAKLHHAMRETPYMANRTLALLSKMFNLAERWGLRPDSSNPCRHVQKYKEQKRERFLSELELARLGKALREAVSVGKELPGVIAAIRLLLFTGGRVSEILTLRWEYIDEERGCIRLPDSKTGAKVIPLNLPALDVLAGLSRDGSPWVIRGGKDGRHLVNLEKAWRRIRETAKIPDVRLHDLRHSFASVGAGANLSLPVIGGLLGHREAATTKRYAHLADDPLRAASQQIGEHLASALRREPDELRSVR